MNTEHFLTIAEASAHIKSDHAEHGYLASPELDGETKKQRLYALNTLHALLHNNAAANGSAGPSALKLI